MKALLAGIFAVTAISLSCAYGQVGGDEELATDSYAPSINVFDRLQIGRVEGVRGPLPSTPLLESEFRSPTQPVSFTPSTIPEPAVPHLIGLALGILALCKFARRRKE